MKTLPATIKIPGFPKFVIIFIISFSQLQGKTQTLDVDKTYNFSPTKLSKKEQEQKTKSMDIFWNKVKSDTTVYLPLLKKELLTSGHEPFFYFDGSGLLLWLDHSRTNEEIAAEAIPNCDLDEVDGKINIEKNFVTAVKTVIAVTIYFFNTGPHFGIVLYAISILVLLGGLVFL